MRSQKYRTDVIVEPSYYKLNPVYNELYTDEVRISDFTLEQAVCSMRLARGRKLEIYD
jgi:hypothetical protein